MTDSEPSPDEKRVRHNGAKDRFVLVSGGMDSVATAHYLLEEKWESEYHAWAKRPVVVFLDTGIGLSSQRLYVELLCDRYGWQLWKLRTHDDFAEISKEQGFYGPQKHSKIFTNLKGRQLDKLSTVSANPHFYTGVRRAESPARSGIEEHDYDEKMGAWFHSPIYDWEDDDVVEYLREHGIPFNPNWDCSHFTDCGCGATATREELIELEAEGYSVMAEKLRSLEEEVETGDRKEMWAWGSFSPDEREWLDDSDNREAFSAGDVLCGPNCSGKAKALSAEYPTDRDTGEAPAEDEPEAQPALSW